ncbi:hypothetical protein GLOTRDRAFT_100926 [Gloeophyllum trabeum ATCC 11539]|uniref:Uncharacterized protein n=1 Tax=Gloeophyllum trabeum (strain ATCC 11539 / FP-39264 / Madison 617) TaxID=670483 RepID=S7RGL3_GLOTA|nr:uncharacterized protein GLOTRDRAFT_100926 [Gloeophyllum trabeum ATCC 11539]EPQ53360.1 hypothetical protein GLOTRDRAFT_100926 [Gloeophyllum trabeum ATCC 11539]
MDIFFGKWEAAQHMHVHAQSVRRAHDTSIQLDLKLHIHPCEQAPSTYPSIYSCTTPS